MQSPVSAPALLTLHDEQTTAVIAPADGGVIASWRNNAGHPLLHAQHDSPTGTCARGLFPMLPWCNRIGAGGFHAGGRWIPLSPNRAGSAWPIHGSAWQQPWEIASATDRAAQLILHSTVPWPYIAVQDIHMRDSTLSLSMQVTHMGTDPVWYGMGLHPYFPRHADTTLQVRSLHVWMATDNSLLPDACRDTPPQWQFDTMKSLPDTLVDHTFDGWHGHARIEQPSLGYSLNCTASGYDYFHLYCPAGREFFCLEPVSHPVNAHHLPAYPGLRLLHRNDSFRCSWEMRYEIMSADPA